MAADLIDGKAIAADVRESVAQAVSALPGAPTLAVVLVGDDAASQVYVRNKIRQTEAAGMRSVHHRLPTDTGQSDVEALISTLNDDPEVDGILLQLPLPAGLDADAAIALIDPAKDVDGLTEISAGRLVLGKPGLAPCTPTGLCHSREARFGRRSVGQACGGDRALNSCGQTGGAPVPCRKLYRDDCAFTDARSSRTGAHGRHTGSGGWPPSDGEGRLGKTWGLSHRCRD